MSDARSWRDWFRRHERRLAGLWLVAAGGLLIAALIGPLRVRGLEAADGLLRRWDARWTVQLRDAERLVADGRWDEAEAALERLDAAHPAATVRHARDKEREHVLRLLARTYEALGRRGRAIETYQRLVAFDPRHYRNHYALAEASDRLLSRATTAVEAHDAWREALRLFPAHLPSVRGVVRYYADRGEFPPIVDLYEQYLDAYLEQPVRVRVGSVEVVVSALVDGTYRDYDVALPAPVLGAARVELESGGFPARVARLGLEPARLAGVADRGVLIDLTAPAPAATDPADPAAWRPGAADALRWPLPADTPAVGAIRLRLALYKPVDAELWSVVSKSYRNLLDEPRRRAAAARTMLFPTVAEADAAFAQPYWASQGLFRGTDGVPD